MAGHIERVARASVKEQIVEAAVETLHQKGFNGATVQDITSAAKVPKGSFSNHFDSKEALAVEALDLYWNRTLNSVNILHEEAAPPLDRLRRYFRHLAGVAERQEFRAGCLIGNMATEMSDQSRAVRERLAVLLAAWTRAIESTVREAQAEGSLRRDLEAKTIAAFLLNAWEGAVMRAKVDRDATSLVSFEDVVFITLTT